MAELIAHWAEMMVSTLSGGPLPPHSAGLMAQPLQVGLNDMMRGPWKLPSAGPLISLASGLFLGS